MLFSAFEKHQYYNLKDLVDITKQPVVRITCAHWALSTVLPREPGVLDGRGRWAGATCPSANVGFHFDLQKRCLHAASFNMTSASPL